MALSFIHQWKKMKEKGKSTLPTNVQRPSKSQSLHKPVKFSISRLCRFNMRHFRSKIATLGVIALVIVSVQILRAQFEQGSLFFARSVDTLSYTVTDNTDINTQLRTKSQQDIFNKKYMKQTPLTKLKRSQIDKLSVGLSTQEKHLTKWAMSEAETPTQETVKAEQDIPDHRKIPHELGQTNGQWHKQEQSTEHETGGEERVSKIQDKEKYTSSSSLSGKEPLQLINADEKALKNAHKGSVAPKDSEKLKEILRFLGKYNNSRKFLNQTKNSAAEVFMLDPGYEYKDILGWSIRPIHDNITLDVSRFMFGKPLRQASILQQNSALCRVHPTINGRGTKSGPFLLVLIPSLPAHNRTRATIRNTWGSVAYNGGTWADRKLNDTVRLLFVFGGSKYTASDREILDTEQKQFGDILVMDFVDSYQNLSLKMANALFWTNGFCGGAKHVLKIDEDTYVHLPQLITMLKHVASDSTSFVLGRQHAKKRPNVVRRGRWRVGLEYPLPHYPRYLYGHSYAISGPAVAKIVSTLRTIPVIKNEDAFITGIVAKVSGIDRFHTKAFAGSSWRQTVCYITRGIYISVTHCCHEHLSTLYRHATQGICDRSKFCSIPTWKCRFFVDGKSNDSRCDYSHLNNMLKPNSRTLKESADKQQKESQKI